jgi:dihydroneopterin aldolase/2-amino-4-hydroxy-6-hydroxymethyldihydropteridine diphosphokinase
MDKISVKGLKVFACHGVLDFEKKDEQPFVFDVEMGVETYPAAKSDNVADTVNYAEVCDTIIEVARGNCFNLIEKLAYECAFKIFEKFEKVKSLTLTVNKPNAPIEHAFDNVSVTIGLERERVILALGSSMGDKKGYLDRAVELLKSTHGVWVKNVSSYLRTEPYGGVAKNEFLNCAVEVETVLSPLALLSETQRIEGECGRVRREHWGDRTLDIDIIYFGGKKVNLPNLIIPHPEAKKRDFVMVPLKEIAPDVEL